jgi:predicted nucleotidyltransferase
MIDVSPAHLQIILDILKTHAPDCEVRAFGSRFKWTAKNYSDLDLVIVGQEKLPFKNLAALQTAFEESDLPYRVDVLDWHAISPEFQKVIEQGYEAIQDPKGLKTPLGSTGNTSGRL